MPFTQCDGVYGLEGNIGWEDTLALFTIEESAIGFKKSLAFQPHGIKQIRRGHLDHQTATWQPMHFTRRAGVDGLEGHTLQGGHVEHRFTLAHFTVAAGFKNILAFPTVRHRARHARASGSPRGLEDTHACVTVEEFAADFMLAFQLRGIKHNRGSSGEGVWIIKRKLGSPYKSCGKVMHRRRGLRSDDADSAILT